MVMPRPSPLMAQNSAKMRKAALHATEFSIDIDTPNGGRVAREVPPGAFLPARSQALKRGDAGGATFSARGENEESRTRQMRY